MSDKFNKLTPAEEERLYLLIEEAGELIQAAGKVLRHGYNSCHPDGGPPNKMLLEKEIGDFVAAKELMEAHDDICRFEMAQQTAKKHMTVIRWLHHQD